MKTNRNLSEIGWYGEGFLDDFLKEELNIKEWLNVRTNSIPADVLTPRILSHWQKMGLITDERENGKGWRKFSTSELIWLVIVIRLRKFGFNLQKIIKVKKHLDFYNVPNNQSKVPLLDFFIIQTLINPMPTKLIVFDTGDALLAQQASIDRAKSRGLIKKDYLSIDFSNIVKEGLEEHNIPINYLNYSSSNITKEVEKSIHLKDLKSITLKKISGEEFLITKEHIKNSKPEVRNLIKNIGNHFEEVTVHSGGKVFYKVIEKKKIKK